MMQTDKSRFGHLLLTAGGLGLAPRAPGTVASAATVVGVLLLDALLLHASNARLPVLLFLALAATLTGVAVLGGPGVHTKDDPRIVLDEVAGMLVAASTAHGADALLVAFVLFRFFDIVKPFGIRKIDARGTAASVFLDDIVAGMIVAAVLVIL